MARSGGQYKIEKGERVLVIPPTKEATKKAPEPEKKGKGKSVNPRT